MLKSNRLDDRPGIRPDVILCDLPYPCCREPGVGNGGCHFRGPLTRQLLWTPAAPSSVGVAGPT